MQNEKNIQIKCHSKLDLESHPILLRNDEILNQVQDDKKWDRDDEGRSKNVGQVLPDNKRSSTFPLDGEGTSSTWRERAGCVSTGVRGKRAFTLIELLVVVLIIGILAAIAVPQYQKAVEKSNVVQLQAAIRTLSQAQEEYFMRTGTYASRMDQLDISFPGEQNAENVKVWDLSNGKHLLITNASVGGYTKKTGLTYYYKTDEVYPEILTKGTWYCKGRRLVDTMGQKVCQSFGGKKVFDKIGCSVIASASEGCVGYTF